MDYAARRLPENYKPLIDAALLRIAHAVGADADAVKARLDALTPDGGPWNYLRYQATGATGDLLVNDKLNEAMPHHRSTSLLDGTLDKYLETYDWVHTADEVDPEEYFDGYPVVLEYYPEESHECLMQSHYVGGGDADIIALWNRGDRHSICHAHMEGFWILGEDPADWIEKIATSIEEKLAS